MNRSTQYLLTILILTSFSTMSAAAQKNPKGLLFHAPPNLPAAAQAAPNRPTITWQRAVTVNPNALPTLRTLPNSVVTMNFFSDATIETILDSVTAHSEKRYVWRGHVFGQEDTSSITLAINDGIVVGNIRCDEGYFQIRVTADGMTDRKSTR
ncbi:MAG: hypothetical protein VCD00_08750, partial [Candidatus Hydrogenedentota bacterium]